MKQEIFEDCLDKWKTNTSKKSYWPELAVKWGYGEGGAERLRSEFRHALKKLGISKDLETKPEEKVYSSPRIGICDIETLPAEVYTWGVYDQYVGLDQVISDIALLGWAGKFFNEPDVFSGILTSREAFKKDDKRIVKECWDFLSKCDVVIGHNWSNFDGKMLNTLFLQYDLQPLKYTVVDTYQVAKSNFRFTSNKMKFINEKLGIKEKIDNSGFPLWKACREGNEEALKEMNEYNVGDVLASEEMFIKFRPYVKNLNVALYNDLEVSQCPVCGNKQLDSIGYYYTSAGKWESVRCSHCGCVSRKKNNLLTKEKKKSLLVNS